MVPPPVPPRPPSLDHFAIFNPSKRKKDGQRGSSQGSAAGLSEPTPAVASDLVSDVGSNLERTEQVVAATTRGAAKEDDAGPSARDLDLEDDLREASQILFYTSRSGSVSRDTMLRQVGLVRGLMGFTEMVAREKDADDYWSFRSHRSRMIVYSPAPDLYFYASLTLAMVMPPVPEPRTTRIKSSLDSRGDTVVSAGGEPAPTAQGLSDQLLVQGLRKGYQEFQLLHGPFTDLVESPNSSTTLEKFWTPFTYDYESTYLSPLNPLELSSDGLRCFPPNTSEKVQDVLGQFTSDTSTDNIGVISSSGASSLYPVDPALVRWLSKNLESDLPPKVDNQATQASPKPDDSRKSSWSTLGLSWVPTISSRSVTPSKLAPSFLAPSGQSDGSKPMLKARPSKQSMASHSRGPSGGSVDSPSTTPRLPLRSGSTSGLKEGGSKSSTDREDKWGFHLGGLTDAMGSLKAPGLDMGNLFRFGTPPAPSVPEPSESTDDSASAHPTSNGDALRLPIDPTIEALKKEALSTDSVSLNDPLLAEQVDTVRSSLEVDPRPGLLPDLEAASKHDIDLGWSSRSVHLRMSPVVAALTEGNERSDDAIPNKAGDDKTSREVASAAPSPFQLEAFTISWIIRDTILLYLLHPSSSPGPVRSSTESVLALYSTLSSILAPIPSVKTPRSSGDQTRETTTWIYSAPSSTSSSANPIGKGSQDALLGLKDWAAHDTVDEVYAKTSTDFLAIKRLDGGAKADGERIVALSLGRKDASLTDTDYAMRGFQRSHPDLVG